MAYLTDDKRTLILKCKECGGGVSYSTNYPFTSQTVKENLDTVLSVWQEKAETCDACLFGPTVGADNVQPQPETGTADNPEAVRPGIPPEVPQEEKDRWTAIVQVNPLKDHTPPRLYDVKECQALLRMSHGRTLKFIREEIIPTGGCVRLGNRYLVHAWAINYALSQRTLPPTSKQTYSPARLAGLKPFRLKSKTTHSLPISSEKQS